MDEWMDGWMEGGRSGWMSDDACVDDARGCVCAYTCACVRSITVFLRICPPSVCVCVCFLSQAMSLSAVR